MLLQANSTEGKTVLDSFTGVNLDDVHGLVAMGCSRVSIIGEGNLCATSAYCCHKNSEVRAISSVDAKTLH